MNGLDTHRRWRVSANFLVGALLVVALGGCGAVDSILDSMKTNIAGYWEGSWVSRFHGSTGGVTVDMAKSGDGYTGVVTFTGSACLASVDVTGNVSNTDQIAFGAVSVERSVHFTGSVNGNLMEGRYELIAQEGSCLQDSGTFIIQRST